MEQQKCIRKAGGLMDSEWDVISEFKYADLWDYLSSMNPEINKESVFAIYRTFYGVEPTLSIEDQIDIATSITNKHWVDLRLLPFGEYYVAMKAYFNIDVSIAHTVYLNLYVP